MVFRKDFNILKCNHLSFRFEKFSLLKCSTCRCVKSVGKIIVKHFYNKFKTIWLLLKHDIWDWNCTDIMFILLLCLTLCSINSCFYIWILGHETENAKIEYRLCKKTFEKMLLLLLLRLSFFDFIFGFKFYACYVCLLTFVLRFEIVNVIEKFFECERHLFE